MAYGSITLRDLAKALRKTTSKAEDRILREVAIAVLDGKLGVSSLLIKALCCSDLTSQERVYLQDKLDSVLKG